MSHENIEMLPDSEQIQKNNQSISEMQASPGKNKYQQKQLLKSQLSIYNEDPALKKKAQKLLEGPSIGIYTDFTKSIKLQKNLRKFANSFLTIFAKKQMNEFKIIQNSANDLMVKLDKKMNDSISQKENLMIILFEKQLRNMVDELNSSKQQCQELLEEIKKNNKVNILEQQVKFFKEQCFELNQIKIQLQEQLNKTKTAKEHLDDEKDIQFQTLLNLEKENQDLKKKIYFHYNNSINSRDQNSIEQQSQYQQQNTNTKFSNSKYNFHQKQSYNYEISEEKQSVQNSIDSSNNLINQTPNTDLQQQQSILLHQNSNFINNFDLREAEEVANKIQMIPTNIVEHSKLIDEFVKEKLKRKERIINQMKNQLKEQKNERIKTPMLSAPTIVQEENELKNLFVKTLIEIRIDIIKRNSQNQNNSTHTNLLNNKILNLQQENDYFLTHLKNPELNTIKLTKQDRTELFQKLIMSQRFMEIVKCKIFEEKCCHNQNCKFNLKDNSIVSSNSLKKLLQSHQPNIESIQEDEIEQLPVSPQDSKTLNHQIQIKKNLQYPPTNLDIIDQKLVNLISINYQSSSQQANSNPLQNLYNIQNNQNQKDSLASSLRYRFQNNRISGTSQNSREVSRNISIYGEGGGTSHKNRSERNEIFDRNKSFDINSYNDYKCVYKQDLTNNEIGLNKNQKIENLNNNSSIKPNKFIQKQPFFKKIKQNNQQIVHMENKFNQQQYEQQNVEQQKLFSSKFRDTMMEKQLQDETFNYHNESQFQQKIKNKKSADYQQGKVYVKDLSRVRDNSEKDKEYQNNYKKQQQIKSSHNWYQNYHDHDKSDKIL